MPLIYFDLVIDQIFLRAYNDSFVIFTSQEPKLYVQTILDVHKKYHALVLTAFDNDAGFVAALDKVIYIPFLVMQVSTQVENTS